MADSDRAAGTSVSLTLQDRPRPERADAARNRRILLDAAARILRDDGVAALSMETVAAAAGVGIGTVYRRFGDRSGLAYALLDQHERTFQAGFMFGAPPLGPGAPAADRLHAFLHRCVDLLSEQAEILAMAESSSQHYQTGAYGVRRRHISMLLDEINPELDATYLADALLATLSGRLFLHQNTDDGMSADRIKSGLDQLLRGITG
ncbi:TetR/AcrR family transcriptional regulator [Phytoactinopolyspora mesophila]|uniref:TetR family transcriptional regulator n=1 Tax=Phytoactinopolyspora mesophila TaxID=2650750 RepID=A0A7K3M605_9ACTN|nr:TetR/AcrR family transcriptional regulator [Phytoactinopolyspora mesophila]NDL58447.1 TetR family transcriptional regulator [Phytoactinopolyspora mesophila]